MIFHLKGFFSRFSYLTLHSRLRRFPAALLDWISKPEIEQFHENCPGSLSASLAHWASKGQKGFRSQYRNIQYQILPHPEMKSTVFIVKKPFFCSKSRVYGNRHITVTVYFLLGIYLSHPILSSMRCDSNLACQKNAEDPNEDRPADKDHLLGGGALLLWLVSDTFPGV